MWYRTSMAVFGSTASILLNSLNSSKMSSSKAVPSASGFIRIVDQLWMSRQLPKESDTHSHSVFMTRRLPASTTCKEYHH